MKKRVGNQTLVFHRGLVRYFGAELSDEEVVLVCKKFLVESGINFFYQAFFLL